MNDKNGVKFQLNPDADAKRRALHRDPKAWIAFFVGWGAGYSVGAVVQEAAPALRISFWGFFVALIAVSVVYTARVAAFTRATRRELPEQPWTTSGLWGFTLGLVCGLAR